MPPLLNRILFAGSFRRQRSVQLLIVVFCVSAGRACFSPPMLGNNITFTAARSKNRKRTFRFRLALGIGLVITLTFWQTSRVSGNTFNLNQNAPEDRVGTASPCDFRLGRGKLMAIAITVSTFGCNNGFGRREGLLQSDGEKMSVFSTLRQIK